MNSHGNPSIFVRKGPLNIRLIVIAWLFFCLVSQIHAREKVRDLLPESLRKSTPRGRMARGRTLDFIVVLPLKNQDLLRQLILDLYDPSGPRYRKFLTPEEFSNQFAPSESEYEDIINAFQKQGFKVGKKYSNRTLIELSGKVQTIESVFQMELQTYLDPESEREFYAPSVAPSIDLPIPNLSVIGLDNFAHATPASLHLRPQGSSTPAVGTAPGGNYWGYDFRKAYAPGVTRTGVGQKVGLVEFDGFHAGDIAQYKSLSGLPNVPVTPILLNGFNGSAGSNNLEVALDIEVAMAMAPGLAEILVYEAPNSLSGYIQILNRMATDNQAKQLSSSWVLSAVYNKTPNAWDQIFQQFAAQGQSFFQASGDYGAYTGGVKTPAGNPYLTSVGGTTLTTDLAGNRVSEKVWNWYPSLAYASSGGLDYVYPTPVWQQDIPNLNGARGLPDISLTADQIWVIYNNGSAGSVGGTSASAPLWAGMMALINEQAAGTGNPPLGFINPALYSLSETSSYSLAFFDTQLGTSYVGFEFPWMYYAGLKFDLCTGLGTPNGKNLISLLAPPLEPFISAPFYGSTVIAGTDVHLAVQATGSDPLHYQWYHEANPIPGNDQPTLDLPTVQSTDSGTYYVVISNSHGSTTSDTVQVQIESSDVAAPLLPLPATVLLLTLMAFTGWWGIRTLPSSPLR